MANVQFNFDLPAMRILENEHRYLKHLMEEWHEIVLHFENDGFKEEVGRSELKRLRSLLIAFQEPLKKHFKKEEEFFFPALGNYIGFDQGPIAAIENEHEEIDAYIGHFLHHTEGDTDGLTLDEMKNIVKDAGEAFEVITVHFVKEEAVLFPMVVEVMNEDGQEELLDHLYTMIV